MTSKRDFFTLQDCAFEGDQVIDAYIGHWNSGLTGTTKAVAAQSITSANSTARSRGTPITVSSEESSNTVPGLVVKTSSAVSQVSSISDTTSQIGDGGSNSTVGPSKPKASSGMTRLALPHVISRQEVQFDKSESLRHTTCAAAPSAPIESTSKSDIGSRPKAPSLFDGFVFYFVPNSRTNVARNLRMKKVEQLGGIISPHFHTTIVTHLIVDKNLSFSLVLRTISCDNIPDSITVLNEYWTPDCIITGKLLDHSVKYTVQGMENLGKPALSAASSLAIQTIGHRQIGSSNQEEQSLQIKKPKLKGELSLHMSDSSNASLSPTVAFQDPVPDPDEFVPCTRRALDDLDQVITVVNRLGNIQLEEECGETDDGLKTTLEWQSKFKCMTPHTESNASGKCINEFVIEKVMQDYYETSQDPGDKWKSRGYRLAISTLRMQDHPITTFEEAVGLPHIGDRLARHIIEIARTGTLERADTLGDDYEILQMFLGIYGVGAARANEFLRQGFRTLDDVLERGDPTKNQRIGIERYKDLNTRIPREEVYQHKKLVELVAAKVDKLLQVYIMGSYRRGAHDCGDIDIMLTRRHTTKSELVELWQKVLQILFHELHYLTHALIVSCTINGTKWQGISKLPGPGQIYRRIDFLMVPWKERGPALLYFTGNDIFNRSMRLLARKKGYTLNQKALLKGALRTLKGAKVTEGENTGAETEEQIFQILGIPFRRPQERCIS